MRVLGVDPGATKIGWAILESQEGLVRLVDAGTYNSSSGFQGTFNEKLDHETLQSYKFFRELSKDVDGLAWEFVPNFSRMGQKDRIVSTLASIKVAVLSKSGRCAQAFSPRVAKSMMTGNSKASKEEMKEEAIRRYPELKEFEDLTYDSYDAVLIATTAIERGEWRNAEEL